MEPRLVVFPGIAGSGKSTVVREVVKRVPNAFVLDKDGLNEAALHVKPTDQGKLPSF